MDHNTAIYTVQALLPQINEGSDPAEVLTKYASEHNLSPAILERLGQVFNTAKTTTFMKEASCRGASFDTLDVEKMVDDYMGLGKEASKGVTKQASGKATVARNPFDIPNLYKEEEMRKLAKDKYIPTKEQEKLEKFLHKKEAAEQAQERRVFLQELDVYRQDLYEGIQNQMEKLARTIYDGGPSLFADLERDSMSSVNGNLNAIDNLAAYMDWKYKGNYSRFDMSKAASVKITRDTTGYRSLLDKLEEDILLYEGAKDMLKAAADEDEYDDDVDVADEYDEDEYQPAPTHSEPRGFAGMGGGIQKQIPAESATASAPQTTFDNPWSPNAIINEERMGQAENVAGAPKAPGKPGEKKEKKDGGEAKAESKSTVKLPTLGISKPIDEASTARIKGLWDKMFARPSVDTRAASRNNARNDISRVSVLHQVISRDPILASADPKRLASLYNTLYTSNPEMMSDPNLLAYMLREAIQYDGVAPHTYEQLAKTYTTQLEGIDKRQKLNKDRYTIQ